MSSGLPCCLARPALPAFLTRLLCAVALSCAGPKAWLVQESATCRLVALRSHSMARKPGNVEQQVDHARGLRIRSSCPYIHPLRRSAVAVQVGIGSSVPCRARLVVVPARCCCFGTLQAVHHETAAQMRDAMPGSCVGATVLPRLRTAAQFRMTGAPEDCGAYTQDDSFRTVPRSACGKRMRAGICTVCWCRRPCSSGCRRFCCRAT